MTSTHILSFRLTDFVESVRGSLQNCVRNQTCSKSRREHGGDVVIDIGLSLSLINKPSESVQNIVDTEPMLRDIKMIVLMLSEVTTNWRKLSLSF